MAACFGSFRSLWASRRCALISTAHLPLVEPVGVLLDVGRVGGVVRQREELEVLVEARLCEPDLRRDRRLGEGRQGDEEEKQVRHGHLP